MQVIGNFTSSILHQIVNVMGLFFLYNQHNAFWLSDDARIRVCSSLGTAKVLPKYSDLGSQRVNLDIGRSIPQCYMYLSIALDPAFQMLYITSLPQSSIVWVSFVSNVSSVVDIANKGLRKTPLMWRHNAVTMMTQYSRVSEMAGTLTYIEIAGMFDSILYFWHHGIQFECTLMNVSLVW